MARFLLPKCKTMMSSPGSSSRGTLYRVLHNTACIHGSNEGTLKYQETLPKFPVPSLQQTCQKYLDQYRIYVSEEEFQATKKVVEEFCKPGGTGDQLQGALLRRQNLKENWLSDWWREYYLQVRDPNVLTSTPGLLMHSQRFVDLNGQITYAAKLVFGLAHSVSSLARHEFPPIKVGGKPICMDQFFNTFSSCRVPRTRTDTFYSQRVDSPEGPRHIVVLRNNHVFKFDILDRDKNPLDAASILKQLQSIVARTPDQGPPIGLLTAHRRERWAELYLKLKEDEVNAKSLHDIQSSLFVLSLDQTETFEDAEKKKFHEARWALCGGGSKQNSGNRWHDKAVQFIIGSDGESGMAGDHSLSDGIVAQACAEMASQSVKNMDSLTSDSARYDLPCPQKLNFVLSNDLIYAMKESGDQIDRLFGRLPRVFETVSLQRFKLGRVDNVRTVTKESAAFIKVFHHKNIQHAYKAEMLNKALEIHSRGIKDAKLGQGMERHLFGLQRIAEESKIQASEFFDDPSWHRSTSIDIRTTSLPGDAWRVFYAPLIQTSCAFLEYSCHFDFMRFAITLREDKNEIDVNRFLEELCACMMDLKNLLESVPRRKN